MENNHIENITLWIRFNRSFRVNDVLGAITDDIVYNEISPFKDMFSGQVRNSWEMLLEDSKSGSSLRMNSDDIILSYNNTEHDSLKNITVKMGGFYNYFKFLFGKYKIDNISRIWIVYSHSNEHDWAFFNSVSNQLTNNTIDSPNTFSIRFSKKLPNENWKLKDGIEDYDNVIYILDKTTWGMIYSKLDYQRYFIPSIDLSGISELDFSNFITNSNNYLNEVYYKNLPINSTTDDK